MNDKAIVRAIGEELRRARNSAGWSRPELIRHMKVPIPVNTYACYEQGLRQCPYSQLFEICSALNTNMPDLIGLALQRVEHDPEIFGARIDLRKVLCGEHSELQPLRQWAHNRIIVNESAHTSEPAIVHLPWVVIMEMAVLCNISPDHLLSYFREFAPGVTDA